ncbi:MAG: AAA family ATPase [Dehalococcoidia bacterium]|nr:AAA family ATPase [Dehalococcoidia bacterium]
MFQAFYGFTTVPFTRGLATAKLFLSGAQEELKARLAYLVRERGIGLITGEIGSGKSTAVRSFVDSLDPTRHTVVYTANPLIGITGFYREVLMQLGEPVPMFRQQMVLGIRRAFDLLSNERKKTPVVILDEAHLVEHRMLEELRLLLNVRMDSQAAAALVLVGHSELRRTLRLSIHEALWQRTSVRFHLRALDLTETGSYIRHQVEVAGYRGTALFSDGFVAKAYDYTKGIPRQINLVCTHALMAGCAQQQQVLDEMVLRQVINDLETAT